MKPDLNSSPHPRYRLLDRIGKGGMGEVFRAHDRLTGQVVALKRVYLPLPTAPIALGVFPMDEKGQTSLGQEPTLAPGTPQASAHFPSAPQLAATWAVSSADKDGARPLARTSGVAGSTPSPAMQALRVHLTQEFHTLAGLRHPHIVSVLDYGFDRERQPYFTMELLEDAIPLDRAARGQPLAVQVGLLLQILQALTYLHRRGVLHRDLKPGNILVTLGPRGPRVKLLDFGLALVTHDLRASIAEIAGTLGYIAPEVLTGASPSVASDLFAVGVMAYEIFVGAHPLGQQPTAVLMQEFLGSGPIFSDDARLSTALSSVLRRALCRAPSDRYADAAALGRDLAHAAHLAAPIETLEIRDSFLQAATFIAREEQLTALKRALGDLNRGCGAVWLIGGESGVGKSRLMDELRTLALVRGTRVVRGQAVSTGGGYQVWQGALRPLCLDAELDDLEAGVLNAVVPDIAKLLERAIPEPPEIDPESAQTRFLITAEKLLYSQREPLVVLLEDLHWTDPGSVALLSRLLRSIAQHPLLIIATYRNDERPQLSDELPGAQSLKLPRLVASEMELLCSSMLGDIGKRRDIVSLLERETAGNAFFVVEVVRALAEEGGTLESIGTSAIPTQLAVGGVQAVLLRRLGRVPEAARPLLCAAAVFGKELDLAVLQALPQELSEHMEEHIAACAAVAVLEVCENRWRFTHDKLREALLAELTPQTRGSWHLRIGEAIERTYATDLSSHAAALGHHFDRANVPDRALPYLLQAGDRATPRGATHEAIGYLDRAVELFDRVAHTPRQRAHTLGLLCRAYHGAGNAEETLKSLERMFLDAGFAMPSSALKCFTDVASLALHHVRFRLGGQPHRSLSPDDIARYEEAADASAMVVESMIEVRSPQQVTYLMLALVAMGERLRDPARMATGYAAMASILALLSIRGLSDEYFQRARKVLAQAPDPPLAVRAYTELVYAFATSCRGEWEQADKALAEDLVYRRRAGDWRHEIFDLVQCSALMLWRGESAAGHAALRKLEELAHLVDGAQFTCWEKSIRAALAMRAGHLEEAARFLSEASEHQQRNVDPLSKSLIWGISALCSLRRGFPADARRYADQVLDLMLAKQRWVYGQFISITAVAETYAALIQMSRDAKETDALARRFGQSLAQLRIASAFIPIGRPQTLLWHGRYAALHGKPRLAKWLFRQSKQSAERYRMPFDEALAHHALAEVALAQGDRAYASAERSHARLLFERLGANWHLAQLETLR